MSADAGERPIGSESDIVSVRKTIRDVATSLGFSVTDVTRIVTVTSELSRNIVCYAGSGTLRWRVLRHETATGLELTFEDHGPGIADIDQALQPGFSTSGGLGLGLPGSKRLMDDLEIQSEPGKGTIVLVRKWLRK